MPTSLDAKIRTRARSLPIGKCYVNSDWEESQMANVIVTRQHTNGNITFGFFLVDLLLLGVKDCFCNFSVPRSELEDRLENDFIKFTECEYVLAHNIIYSGIDFAEDCGFTPVKDFIKTGKCILEADTDDIPQIDIPVGEDGVPVVFITPEKDMKREIAILEEAVGQGNYYIYHIDESGNIVDDDDNDDEDDYDETYEEIMEEINNTGVDEYLAENKDNLSPMQMLALTDISYHSQFGVPDVEKVEEVMMSIFDDDRFDPELERLPGMEPYTEALQSIVNKMVDDEDEALVEMEALSAAHPKVVDLGVLHINILRDLNRMPEVEQLTKYWYDRVSGHYAVRLMYAELLIDQEKYDEIFDFFGNHPGLDALTTEDLPFPDVMVAEFCACYTMAWLAKDNIAEAEPYYRILLRLDGRTSFINNALMTMMTKKRDAAREAFGI